MGEGGLEPPNSSEDRFTVCCNCRYATSPLPLQSLEACEPMEGFEPPTPRLQITCSTAELRRQQLLTAFASAKIQKIFILTTFFKLFFIFFDIGFSRSYSVSSQRLSTKPHHSGNQQLAYPIIPKYVPNTQPCHH